MTTTAKGVPHPTDADDFDVVGWLDQLVTWVDARPGIAIYTTAQRDVLVNADIWAGRVIYNATNQRLEINKTGQAGAAKWTELVPPTTFPTDGPADTPSLRTLGAGAQQAAPGNDARFSDARTPTGAAGGDLTGGYPNPTIKPSVGLTGTPTAPTAAAGANTTQIATTAFVRAALAALVAAAPGTLDTLDELAAALGDDPNFATTVTNLLATKAPKVDATLTGTTTVGDSDDDVLELRAVEVETHERSTTITTDPGTGLVTQIVEKAGATTVRTADLAYTDGVLTTVTETGGGVTATTTLTYDGAGTLTGTTRSVA